MIGKPPLVKLTRVLIALAVVAVIFGLGALLNLGPFREQQRGPHGSGFALEGDQICRATDDAFEQLQRNRPRTPSEAATLTGGLIRAAESQQQALGDLVPPAGLAVPLDDYLEARAAAIELMREGRKAAAAGETKTYDEVQRQLAASQVRRHRLAADAGLTGCSG